MAPVHTLFTVLIVATGVLGIAGVMLSSRSVAALTDELNPAVRADDRVLQNLTDAETSVRAWSLSGQKTVLTPYETGMRELVSNERVLREFAAGDPVLAGLVRRQEEAAQRWVEEYARVRVARDGGPGTFDETLFSVGKSRFDELRSAHDAVEADLARKGEEAKAAADLRISAAVVGILVVALLAVLVAMQAGRRLRLLVARPLGELETAVQEIAGGGRVHVPVTGSREVRAIAAALNDLAEAQLRARAVEGRIQQDLRTLDTAKDDFVSNVSHELRTPLTTISGYLEMVAEEFEGSLEPRHQRMLEATRRNVLRLKQLIDDLLTLSRAEGRSTDLEQVELGAVVRDAVTDLRMTASRRGIGLRVTLPEERVLVLADRAMLHRAFLNVLSNAVKFSRDGGTVEVELSRADRQATVSVRDHGIGIPEAELDRLGSRFFRASNAVSNEIAGTGLGLRIVQTIVDKHGGDVVVDSVEGRGTSVAVRLQLHGDGPEPG